jgi:WXG100 family type VII secretion target
MSDILQDIYEDLAHVAKLFETEADTLESLARQIQILANELEQEGWIGRGSSAFFTELHTDVLPRLRRLSEALADSHKVTEQISERMQTAEHEAARLFIDPLW